MTVFVYFQPPWMGNGTSGHGYAKNSEKYLAGTFGDWKERPQTTKRRGYGKADVTLKRLVVKGFGLNLHKTLHKKFFIMYRDIFSNYPHSNNQ